MKKIIFIFVIVIIGIWLVKAFGQIFTTQNPPFYIPTWGKKYAKHEYQCTVCGKSIFRNEEVEESIPRYYDNMGISMNPKIGWEDIPDSLLAVDVVFQRREIWPICNQCKEKYADDIIVRLASEWTAYWENLIVDNAKNRKYYDKLRKKMEIKRKEEQIKTLEDQLKELKSKEKPQAPIKLKEFDYPQS